MPYNALLSNFDSILRSCLQNSLASGSGHPSSAAAEEDLAAAAAADPSSPAAAAAPAAMAAAARAGTAAAHHYYGDDPADDGRTLTNSALFLKKAFARAQCCNPLQLEYLAHVCKDVGAKVMSVHVPFEHGEETALLQALSLTL